jgi:predicted ATPase
MKKNPNVIKNIEIKYFRSINSQRIRECKPINVITGPNDVGKSNLLRALNLFFYEKNELGQEIIFQDESSHSRLNQVRQESIKGKQFIQIEIEFNRQDSFLKTLPVNFKVKKTWYRESSAPIVSNNLDQYLTQGKLSTTKTKAEASLRRFLGSIVFTYIPAIKDKGIFQTVLADLQTALLTKSDTAEGFMNDIARFNGDLEKQAQELRAEFGKLTGIETRISLPSSYSDLFRAFNIRTAGPFKESVALDNRGDGVRVRFLPAILNYIAEKSSKLHVWGFEEPENSMEYKRAFELASTMSEAYCHNAQIFLTTHSPAFIDLNRSNQAIYLAKAKDGDTEFSNLNSRKDWESDETDPFLMIADELGHIKLMNELHKRLQAGIAKAEEIEKNSALILDELNNVRRPVLLTEGKTDVLLLKAAWAKLRNDEPPFEIKSCNVLSAEDEGDAAGAIQLGTCLKAIMHDQPNLVIGLFDRDSEGRKQWELNRNFTQPDLFSDVKVAKNNKAFAILLPLPAGAEKFDKSDNHCIEYMFPKDALSKKVDGRGLTLTSMPIVQRCGPMILSETPGTELWQMKIEGGKKEFAEVVAPTLEKENFDQFEKIFELIEQILEGHIKPTRSGKVIAMRRPRAASA